MTAYDAVAKAVDYRCRIELARAALACGYLDEALAALDLDVAPANPQPQRAGLTGRVVEVKRPRRKPRLADTIEDEARVIVGMLADGSTVDDIAAALVMSRHGAKSRLKAIYREFGVGSAAAAVHQAWLRGWFVAEEVAA